MSAGKPARKTVTRGKRLLPARPLTPRQNLLVLGVIFGGAVGAQLALRQFDARRPPLLALALRPARDLFPSEQAFEPKDVEKLLRSVPLEVVAPASGAAKEPPLSEGVPAPLDLNALGHSNAPFLVTSRWATVRYLGDAPAGRGLKGEELEAAQKAALGKHNDTIPVVTSVVAINRMMDEYFAPLLESVPGGREILGRIKVQGAYFSPTYSGPSAGGRDNAYIVGLQSLYIYPHGCFLDDGNVREGCEPPFFSTGHDPTVIGHELGHVVFNHMRGMKSLEGFQWFAVNEGYADYFSASYFGDPLVGRVWKVNQRGAPYLRRLLDNPSVDDEAYARETHAFSVVWSSTLWRVRQRLVAELKARPQDVDRVVLSSIPLLGETEKTRLGDAGTALMQSAESLGFPEWKPIMRKELEDAKVLLAAPPEAILERRGKDLQAGATAGRVSGNGCGVIADTGRTRLDFAPWFLLAPLTVALGIGAATRSARLLRPFRAGLRAPSLAQTLLALFSGLLAVVLGTGCKWGRNDDGKVEAPGWHVAYSCTEDTFEGGQKGSNVVYFTWYESTSSGSPVQRVLVSDARFERSPSSIIVVLDRETLRLEQARNRDGIPLELAMTKRFISRDEALSYQLLRVANLVLDLSPNALARAQKEADASRKSAEPTSASASPSSDAGRSEGTSAPVREAAFQFEERPFLAKDEENVKGAQGYGPLATRIVRKGSSRTAESVACKYEGALSSKK